MGDQAVSFLFTFVLTLKNIIIWLIFARVILSWIPSNPNFISRFVNGSTEPVFALARKITPRIGVIDISPIIAYIGIELIASFLIYIINISAPQIIKLFS